MRALLLTEENSFPTLSEVHTPESLEGEVITRVHTAGMNRRDFYICKGLYPKVKLPVILGSDGCVETEGNYFIVNPGFGWPHKTRCQPDDYAILGMPRNGTFADFLTLPTDRLLEKPDHLELHEAGCLGLGGLTAYRALFTKGECMSDSKVLITGIGGGVATMAMKFALAIGCDVYVTTGARWKGEKALELGAKGFVDYKDEDWVKDLGNDSGGFDVVIDSAGGNGFAGLVKLANPGCRIVTYGGTAGKINGISPQLVFWRQIAILGSTMGSDEEFAEMIRFVDKHKVRPMVSKVFGLSDPDAAFNYLGMSEGMGNVVFDMSL